MPMIQVVISDEATELLRKYCYENKMKKKDAVNRIIIDLCSKKSTTNKGE